MRTRVAITATTPTTAITLADFRLYAKANNISAEDGMITDQIKAAVKFVENYIQQSINANTIDLFVWEVQDFDLSNDGLRIELPFTPITAITSVKAYDNAGTETTLTLDSDWYKLQPSEIVRVEDFSYDTYKFTYTAGMNATELDDNIKEAILKIAAELYDKRATSVIGTITAEMKMSVYKMLNPYRKHLNW